MVVSSLQNFEGKLRLQLASLAAPGSDQWHEDRCHGNVTVTHAI